MIRYLLIITFVLTSLSLYGQSIERSEVANGGVAQGSSVSVSWSVGQVAQGTAGNLSVVSQGFQQSGSFVPGQYTNTLVSVAQIGLQDAQESFQGTGSFTVYPNPFESSFEIVFDVESSESASELYIIDTSGKVVFYDQLSTENRTVGIDLVDQMPGVYTVRMVSHSGVIHKKIIKR
ncbi:MAG: T9SS type A sorting domain-containing protein [Bacteroidota bacterium]